MDAYQNLISGDKPPWGVQDNCSGWILPCCKYYTHNWLINQNIRESDINFQSGQYTWILSNYIRKTAHNMQGFPFVSDLWKQAVFHSYRKTLTNGFRINQKADRDNGGHHPEARDDQRGSDCEGGGRSEIWYLSLAFTVWNERCYLRDGAGKQGIAKQLILGGEQTHKV